MSAAGDAALAALAPEVHRLGLMGVALEPFVAQVLDVAGPELVAEVKEEMRLLVAELVAAHAEHVATLERDRDAALAALPPVRVRVSELERSGSVRAASVTSLGRRAGYLAEALSRIERLPYDGPEPMWRKIAREALA